MRDKRALIILVGLAAVLAFPGCGEDSERATAKKATPSVGDKPLTVPAKANIFAAGHDSVAAARGRMNEPGGGGAGVPPALWRVPQGAHSLTFPMVKGAVTAVAGLEEPHDAYGSQQHTDVLSHGGISGMRGTHFLFLAGVFLTDERPAAPAPRRLEASGQDNDAPRIGQTFHVGGGLDLTVRVPPKATRLFLGFVDGYCTTEPCLPGWYDNNAGELQVRVKAAT